MTNAAYAKATAVSQEQKRRKYGEAALFDRVYVPRWDAAVVRAEAKR